MSLTPGAHLGPYEILSPLGAGGMGEVYRAKDSRLGREVAIKVLPESTAKDPEALARFEREAKAVAALSHPNILALHDVGHENGVAYAVMELLEGETLRARLIAGMIPPRKLADYARQIAEGLAAAHEKGIVHRDLKPENLWVTADGRMKILDFGLAKLQAGPGIPASGENTPTRSVGTEPGMTLGTAGYMSPEQVRGEPADHRSDIFSFGAVLYEMASGKRAFKKNSAVETMSAILNEEPPELSLSATVAPGLERIIRHCLEKNAVERFQSARDLAFDLSSLSGTTGGGAPIAAGAGRTKRWNAVLLLTAGIALLAGVFWIGRRSTGGGAAGALTSHRLTFQRGNLLWARFTPDGESVIYSASWNGEPPELYTVRLDGGESRPLGLKSANILAVSTNGELAVKLHKSLTASPGLLGTLARFPISGGTPREILENVHAADWNPAGTDLAVVVAGDGGKWRIEYPPGHSLYESLVPINFLRFSLDGSQLAFSEGMQPPVRVLKRLAVASGQPSGTVTLIGAAAGITGMAWGPGDREIWYSVEIFGRSSGLHAIDLHGRSRPLEAGFTEPYLHDRSRTGRLLIEDGSARSDMIAAAAGGPERVQSWLDGTTPVALRDDGRTLLFNEMRDGGGQRGRVLLYRNGASPPLDLGEGRALDLSPDGGRVLLRSPNAMGELTLAPVGAGQPQKLATGLEGIGAARFLPDGQELLLCARAAGAAMRIYRLKLKDVSPQPITRETGFDCNMALSPDGREVALNALQAESRGIYPLDGGAPRPLAGIESNEIPLTWSADGKAIYFLNRIEIAGRIFRYDIATGRRELVRRLLPADPAGMIGITTATLSPDGRSYAYSYNHSTNSDLHVIEGLK